MTTNIFSDHWLFGQTKARHGDKDAKFYTGEWLEKYGGVFRRPGPFGSSDLCVLDPKAVGHILGNSEVSFVLKCRDLCKLNIRLGSENLPPSSYCEGRRRKYGSSFLKIHTTKPTPNNISGRKGHFCC
jgi:hypothetical protein